VTGVTAGFGLRRQPHQTGKLVMPNHPATRHRTSRQNLRNLKGVISVLSSDCKSEVGAMRNFLRGIWTCAALYVAIGLIGIFLLTGQGGIATSSDGYGVAAIAAPASLR